MPGAMDPDMLFKYCTPKYVYIRDAKLGIMKYSMMLLIFFYVVVYHILYKCEHLAPHHAQGFGNMYLKHPVLNCNEMDRDCMAKFDNIGNLPYCSQYATNPERRLEEDKDSEEDGKSKDESAAPAAAGPAIGESITQPRKCRYLDDQRLEWSSGVPSEIFVPTRYQRIKQTLNPDCYNPELHGETDLHGEQKYRCKSAWITETVKDFYVADIEEFKIHMTHAYSAPPIGMSGQSVQFQGLFAACPNNHPTDVVTECKRAKIPNTAGDIAPEDAAGLLSADDLGLSSLSGATDGSGEDTISFGDFLKATPVAQNEGITHDVLDAKLPDSFGHPGKSLREVGGMLLLDVDYSNTGKLRPGLPGLPEQYQIKPITYLYRPYFVPTNANEKYQLLAQSDHAEWRIVDIWYGVTIKMQFNGQLVVFSWSKVLKALTSGLVLLSMATTLVCYAASYVLPLQEKYNALMYQMSEDFSQFGALRKSYLDKNLGDAWKKRTSVFASGTTLMKHLNPDGSVAKEINNVDIIRILATTEMRLNRLDAMDPRMIYAGDDEYEKASARKLILKAENDFYDAAIKNGPLE